MTHVVLDGEEEGSELLSQLLLLAVPRSFPPDRTVGHLQSLQCWSEESKLTLSTLLRLCAALPSLRYLDVCSIVAPADDVPGLIAMIRAANAFPNIEQFELGLYCARDMPLTVAYAMMECMPSLRHVRLDVVHAPDHNAEREHIQQLDLSHIRLRNYFCIGACVGWDLPIKHSPGTLERLEITLDDNLPVQLAESMPSMLRSQDFVRLRTLRLVDDAADAFSGGLRCMLLILKECPRVSRLLVRCALWNLQTLINAMTAPLYELAVLAARGTVTDAAAVDAELAAICACLSTIPTLHSLRRLRLISDSDESELHAVDLASQALQGQLARMCVERRIELITFEDYYDHVSNHLICVPGA